MIAKPDYRIPFAAVSGVSQGTFFWRIIEKAWPDIEEPDEMKRLGFATPGQRAILAITLFIREVDNGGLQQFFGNSTGQICDEVIVGFERLGAPDYAATVRQALSFFGPVRVTPDQAARSARLSSLPRPERDAFFDPLDEKLFGETRLWPIFKLYVDKHPEEFFNDMQAH